MVVKYQKKIMRILNCTRMISKKNTTYFNVFGESVDTEPDNTEVTQIVAFEDYKLKVRQLLRLKMLHYFSELSNLTVYTALSYFMIPIIFYAIIIKCFQPGVVYTMILQLTENKNPVILKADQIA